MMFRCGKVWAVVVASVVAARADNPTPVGQEMPPREEWVVVHSVPDESAHIEKHGCTCGGRYAEGSQATGERHGRHFDRVDVVCTKCGRKMFFTFDVTSVFENMEFGSSKSARTKAETELNRRYPKITPELLPELKLLLTNENVHYRRRAIEAIAQIPTDEARETLVRGYIDSSVFTDIELLIASEEAIGQVGGPMVPLIDRALGGADRETHWKLMDVLGQIPVSEARVLLERELRTGPERSKRMCAISLGTLAFTQSQPALLEEYQRTEQNPDDALIWALGRCGDDAVYPVLRKLVDVPDGVTRWAAIAALGLAGDRASISRLIELVQTEKGEARRLAVYALGKLRARDAVPMLLELAGAPPSGTFGHFPVVGVYAEEFSCDYEGNVKSLSIKALGDIGDERAIPFFRDALGRDEYDLYADELAEAAGLAGFKELVPAVIERFAKEHPRRLEYYKDRELPEEYAPALRKLTGESFGENPELWVAWLKRTATSQPTPTTRPAAP